LPDHEESAEDLVSLAARAGLAWLEGRSREGDSLGQLGGYSVTIKPSPPLRESSALCS
jgi:hypothetical protein